MNEEQIKDLRDCIATAKQKYFYSVESTRHWFETSGFLETLNEMEAWAEAVRSGQNMEEE